MNKVWKFIKKYWQILAGASAAIAGAIIFRGRRQPPPHIKPPPEEPPPEEKPQDFVEEHKEEKRESDQKVDDMSRSDLISDINDKYG